MGQIRQSFSGGNRRFKKLLLSSANAPILQVQDYQTNLKLAFGKHPALGAPYKPENTVDLDYADIEARVVVGPASCGKTTLLR